MREGQTCVKHENRSPEKTRPRGFLEKHSNMKLPLLFSLFALSLPVYSRAGEPVYDIGPSPQANQGKETFQVSVLAGEHGPEGLGGRLMISRDETGLIVRVSGPRPAYSTVDVKDPDKWNSVEIFFGSKKGSGEYYETIINTDYAPDEMPAPRVVFNDSRKSAPAGKPGVQVKMERGARRRDSPSRRILRGAIWGLIRSWGRRLRSRFTSMRLTQRAGGIRWAGILNTATTRIPLQCTASASQQNRVPR